MARGWKNNDAKKKKKIRWNAQHSSMYNTPKRSVNVQGKYSWRIINLFYSTNKPFLSRPSNNKCPISKIRTRVLKKKKKKPGKRKRNFDRQDLSERWTKRRGRIERERKILDERSGPVPKRVNKLEIYFEFRGFAASRRRRGRKGRRRRRRTAGWVLSRKDLYIAAGPGHPRKFRWKMCRA